MILNPYLDLLLSAGKEILLWSLHNTNWNIICRKKPASDILLAKFEPKSSKFATVGKVNKIRVIHVYWQKKKN